MIRIKNFPKKKTMKKDKFVIIKIFKSIAFILIFFKDLNHRNKKFFWATI